MLPQTATILRCSNAVSLVWRVCSPVSSNRAIAFYGSSMSPNDEADRLAATLQSKLHIDDAKDNKDPVTQELKQMAKWINESERILVLTGAGVSVSAGIPDFRTPKTGLYDNLQKYNLPYAEAVFDIDFYRLNPEPFVLLASEIWPSTERYVPTLTHAFVKVLESKGKLLRIYTQNIDGLERAAGITEESLIECHGHFRSGRCIECDTKVKDMEEIKTKILTDQKVPMCEACEKGYVKPDIVFFGEQLPSHFHDALQRDVHLTDLCLVMGTSLQVPPVAHIPSMVRCPRRILLNRERVGNFHKRNDLFHSGNCDDSVLALAKMLGWEEEVLDAHRMGGAVSESGDNIDKNGGSTESAVNKKDS